MIVDGTIFLQLFNATDLGLYEKRPLQRVSGARFSPLNLGCAVVGRHA
jgi:hypothetical protein